MAKSSGDDSVVIDFTNVKEREFAPKHQPAGDYIGTVVKVDPKYKSKAGNKQWLYTIKVGIGLYPYYCALDSDNAWKIRNLFVAAGFNVPKQKKKVNPHTVVGKQIGVTLGDDEYDGKLKSVIEGMMPVSEVTDTSVPDASEHDEEVKSNGKAPAAVASSNGKKDKKGKKGKKDKATVSDDELEEIEVSEL